MIKATYLNACLVHVVNESLQGYFFVTLNSFINAINHAHKLSGVENLETFVKMQGFYAPVGVPLVQVEIAGTRQFLALAEVSEQLTWSEIKKMMQDPIILAHMANNTGVSTLIITCEFIEPKSSMPTSRSGQVNRQDKGMTAPKALAHAYLLRLTEEGWTIKNPGEERAYPLSDAQRVRQFLEGTMRMRVFAWYNTDIDSLKDLTVKQMKDAHTKRMIDYHTQVQMRKQASGKRSVNTAATTAATSALASARKQ
jgi:DNA-binding protein YbaB